MSAVLMLILAVTPGNALTSSDIQRYAWPEQNPDDKTSARLRSIVRDTRKRLASASVGLTSLNCPPYRAIVAGSPSYTLGRAQTDFDTFTSKSTRARVSLHRGDALDAWQLTDAALGLFRGMPLADAGHRAFAVEPIRDIERARLAAQTTHFEAALGLGMHREILPSLQKTAASWPADFGITCLLVTALARSGWTIEASEECYAAIRRADVYGIPVAPYRRLQYDLLNGRIPASGPPWRPEPPAQQLTS